MKDGENPFFVSDSAETIVAVVAEQMMICGQNSLRCQLGQTGLKGRWLSVSICPAFNEVDIWLLNFCCG